MKKTYFTPAVQMNGSVVGETRLASQGQTEFVGFRRIQGSLGFNL